MNDFIGEDRQYFLFCDILDSKGHVLNENNIEKRDTLLSLF